LHVQMEPFKKNIFYFTRVQLNCLFFNATSFAVVQEG
jgi:hypothetical protein